MQIVLAHSDKKYSLKIKEKFIDKHLNNIYMFNEGFDALAHIIKNHSKLVIIEENLPNLNASDIKKALIFKGIKSRLVIIKDKSFNFDEIEDLIIKRDNTPKKHILLLALNFLVNDINSIG